MQSWTKSLIWLLYNQTRIAVASYRDTFHLVQGFTNSTSPSSLEHLFDSIETINTHQGTLQRVSVPWSKAIQSVVTQIFKRRFLLPVAPLNVTDHSASTTNDSMEEEIYTEPYPLVYNDEQAIKTILNISTILERPKRASKARYNRDNHVLVILTTRSKSLYDYTSRDQRLAALIASVPLRVVTVDFNPISNRKVAEGIHSAFMDHAKHALASVPIAHNYIEMFEERGDALHGNQLFNHHDRLCHSAEEKTRTTSNLVEASPSGTIDCPLITLLDNRQSNATLKERTEYTFYQTAEQCFSAPVYRSISDRNLYLQRISNGRWFIIRVDPLLPAPMIVGQQSPSTTTSTFARKCLVPIERELFLICFSILAEFVDATDYASGPLLDETTSEMVIVDVPVSVPHCSDRPGIDTLWESDDSVLIKEFSLSTSRSWFSHSNQTDVIIPKCNKYKLSCQTANFDLLLLLDCQQEYSVLLQIFLSTFLGFIEPNQHRFSLIVLSSGTVDPFQYHLPLTAMNTLSLTNVQPYLLYMDQENRSIVPLHEHLERISEHMTSNRPEGSSSMILTVSSRLDFNRSAMENLTERYAAIRYMALDPNLKIDHNYQPDRDRLLRSLTSKPSSSNLFQSYAANRDLTFSTVLRILEALCGYLH